MRDTSRIISLRTALMAALTVLVLLPAVSARAEDDDSGEDFDNKIFRGVLEGLGLRAKDNDINYRERSPLVVPPNTTMLPPPDAAAAAQASVPANWPVDQDVKRARESKAAARKQRYRQGDSVMEDGRPLSPSEMARTAGPRTVDDSNHTTMEESYRPSRPSALGVASNTLMKAFSGKDDEEVAVFRGEPVRESLTEPPSGYQTPSPTQPYGLTGVKALPKAQGKQLEAVR